MDVALTRMHDGLCGTAIKRGQGLKKVLARHLRLMFIIGSIAQIVEQRPLKATVEGASPSWPTSFLSLECNVLDRLLLLILPSVLVI